MKKFFQLFLIEALVLPSVASAADGNFPMAGCGPWYLLFGHKDNTKGTQIGVWFLNTFVFPGPYLSSSMSSGTSGCNEKGDLRWVRSAEIFAEANFDVLKKEMAQGDGEYVRTFATLLGANDAHVTPLVELMKQKYTALLPSEVTTHDELMTNLAAILNDRRELVS